MNSQKLIKTTATTTSTQEKKPIYISTLGETGWIQISNIPYNHLVRMYLDKSKIIGIKEFSHTHGVNNHNHTQNHMQPNNKIIVIQILLSNGNPEVVQFDNETNAFEFIKQLFAHL